MLVPQHGLTVLSAMHGLTAFYTFSYLEKSGGGDEREGGEGERKNEDYDRDYSRSKQGMVSRIVRMPSKMVRGRQRKRRKVMKRSRRRQQEKERKK